MNNLQPHPDDGLLLRYFDGELSGRKARQVKRHLSACWQCRTYIDELQRTVAECVRYRKNVLERHLPGAPAPWIDLANEFPRVDSELASELWIARLGGWLRAPAI